MSNREHEQSVSTIFSAICCCCCHQNHRPDPIQHHHHSAAPTHEHRYAPKMRNIFETPNTTSTAPTLYTYTQKAGYGGHAQLSRHRNRGYQAHNFLNFPILLHNHLRHLVHRHYTYLFHRLRYLCYRHHTHRMYVYMLLSSVYNHLNMPRRNNCSLSVLLCSV